MSMQRGTAEPRLAMGPASSLLEHNTPVDLFPSPAVGEQAVDLTRITPFLRTLLATDGTVTKMIEAYHLDEVEVVCLQQDAHVMPRDNAWLDSQRGAPVLVRQVLLRGRRTGSVYLYAVSLLRTDRMQDSIVDGLVRPGSGLGRLLLESRIESRREILSVRRRATDRFTRDLRAQLGSTALSRTYRIIARQQPIMLINENFPSGDG